jgi:hypothetical protein
LGDPSTTTFGSAELPAYPQNLNGFIPRLYETDR